MEELRSLLPPHVTLKQYSAPEEVRDRFLDGGVSIIDQWILAHARFKRPASDLA